MKKILSILIVSLAAFAAVSCKQEPRPGEVHGIVNYRDRPAENITVTYTGATTMSFETLSTGYYYLRNIPAGIYEVSLSYDGRDLNFDIENNEKAEYPYRVVIADNGYHVRNLIIDEAEDIGWTDEGDDEEEDEE